MITSSRGILSSIGLRPGGLRGCDLTIVDCSAGCSNGALGSLSNRNCWVVLSSSFSLLRPNFCSNSSLYSSSREAYRFFHERTDCSASFAFSSTERMYSCTSYGRVATSIVSGILACLCLHVNSCTTNISMKPANILTQYVHARSRSLSEGATTVQR